ncbi:MAG: hypothetical protein HYX40_01795 [Sphingobacteriales bacterium]|nr:hypothetical protein [Sphingobacteriales bacterium]
MERVGALIQKLQQLYNEKADPAQLLATVQLIQAELSRQATAPATSSKVSVIMPNAGYVVKQATAIPVMKVEPEEKIIEVLKVDEAEIEAELEEIKRKAALVNKTSTQAKPATGYLFDPVEDVPTLAHNIRKPEVKEVNDAVSNSESSLNDKLKEAKKELAEHLSSTPVKDLKKAIGINDRFVFINELFRGDEAMYERSIKTINSYSIYQEARYWMERELKLKLGWDMDKESVQHFYDLVRRRFL